MTGSGATRGPRRTRAEAWVGRTIAGRYRLTRVIGLGGHSAVFEATAGPDSPRVAVKLLLLEEGTSPSVSTRFLREARTAGRVRHSNVVAILDAGADPEHDVSYLVQELLVGADLRARLAASGPLPPAAALSVVVPMARALEAAHAAGVVHRDLKPANVFLARGDDGATVPKLIDFGISKVAAETDGEPLTMDGALLGTPDYMSPEQARGRPDLDGRSDVWSLAVVLYEALAGRRPFVGPNYNAVIVAIAHDEPPRLDALVDGLPPALVECVHWALTKDPARRTATMGAFRAALEGVAAALPPSPPLRASEAVLAGGPDTLDPALVEPDEAPPPALGAEVGAEVQPDTLPPVRDTFGDVSGALGPGRRRIPWSTLALVLAFLAVGTAGAWWGLRGMAGPPPASGPSEATALLDAAVDAGPVRARPTQPVAADLSIRADLMGPRPGGRLPERITVTQLRSLLPPRAPALRGCVGPTWFGAVTVGFRVTGDGVVREARVRGSLAETPVAACIEAALRAEPMPRFAAREQRFVWTWSLR